MFHIKSYPETEYKYKQGSEELEIFLPWLYGRVPYPSGVVEEFNDLSKANVDEFINNHGEYFIKRDLPFLPFCQVEPRRLSDFIFFETENEKTIHRKIPNEISNLLRLLDVDPELISRGGYFFEKHWLWDSQSILNECKVEGTEWFDPISIYTSIRRLRNLDSLKRDYSVQLSIYLNDLLETDEPKFFDNILKLLNQSFYVTSNCINCISPAVNLAEFKTDRIKRYIDEENGHHHLVQKSITFLKRPNLNIEDICYAETKVLMNALKYCAENHSLSFCCLIGAFEQTAQFPSDPIADMLLRSSKPGAADGILKHFEINRLGEHSEVGLQLAMEVSPVNINEALFALYFSELYVILLEGVAYKIITNANE